LPPLPKLTIRRPVEANANPCLTIMATMLGCWASNGHTSTSCASLETNLRSCMDARKPAASQRSPINSQLSRLYPQIRGPYKR
ncbi:uncharacterized protein K489DRAFT_308719, partial [Dissoconium aciculare CBS 342.82]|uniref:37S ribosomal protein mrp10, mitochondrial n=1 Tax=Dissoconium aciculare CBS 342.82 TaxID=1314786 RepID=A0A6J3M2D4_9PEZI